MTLARPLLRHVLTLAPNIRPQPTGPLGGIPIVNRIVKYDHDPVPHEPFQSAFVSEDELAHTLVILLEEGRDLFRFGRLGECGEAAQITEHHRYLTAMTRQKRVRRVRGSDHLRHLRGEKSP